MIKSKRGRGIKYRGNYRYVSKCGNGMFDILKPIVKGIFEHKDLISKTVNIAKDVYTTGKNVRDAIKRKPERNVSEIIEKIRALKTGEGFAYA